MILARENRNHNWDGKRATMTAGELFKRQVNSGRNRFTALSITIALICFLGLGHIALNHNIALQSKQLEELQTRATFLRDQNEDLEVRIHKAAQLGKMEQLAMSKLKMIKPGLEQMLFIPQ